jgi:hypothetical protein
MERFWVEGSSVQELSLGKAMGTGGFQCKTLRTGPLMLRPGGRRAMERPPGWGTPPRAGPDRAAGLPLEL